MRDSSDPWSSDGRPVRGWRSPTGSPTAACATAGPRRCSGWPTGQPELNRDDAGVELAVLAVAGIVALGLGTVWVGANAAALVFGTHHALAEGLHATARALPHLVSRPGTP